MCMRNVPSNSKRMVRATQAQYESAESYTCVITYLLDVVPSW